MFCISILQEKEAYEKDISIKNDYKGDFYGENALTLNKLYYINFRMAVIDLYAATGNNEENSYAKIVRCIKSTPFVKKNVNDYELLIQYLDDFKNLMVENKIINSVKKIRDTYIAHTDNINKRVKFKDELLNIYDLKNIANMIFVFIHNVRFIVDNNYEVTEGKLYDYDYSFTGFNNTFEKISKYYNKSR